MAMLLLGLGGAAAISSISSYFGAREQAKAAREAASAQAQAGELGQQIIGHAGGRAEFETQRGYQGALKTLRSAEELAAQERAGIPGYFADERAAGGDALAQLRALILNGDTSALGNDAGYRFRQQQGEQALSRAAAAAGSFGGGANLRDFMSFNQGLASEETNNAVNRLLALQGIGSNATRSQLAFDQGLLGQQLGLRQNIAGNQQGMGNALAQLIATTGANQANALTGNQATVNQYNLDAANANAQFMANTGNSLQQLATLTALQGGQPGAQGGGGGGYTQSPYRASGSITTSL